MFFNALYAFLQDNYSLNYFVCISLPVFVEDFLFSTLASASDEHDLFSLMFTSFILIVSAPRPSPVGALLLRTPAIINQVTQECGYADGKLANGETFWVCIFGQSQSICHVLQM